MLAAAILVATQTAECRAAGTSPAMLEPSQRCGIAIRAAERTARIPARLLTAIGLVESGRDDPRTGTRGSWPWTVNVAGEGHFYGTKSEAISAVRDWQAHGVQSIDVGCMQVNLMHHPDAFATLQEAFDPVANATFASRFLTQLFRRTGNWTRAAAAYHSATPEVAAPYERKVVMLWQGDGEQPKSAPTDELAQAWKATLSDISGRNQASLAMIAARSGRVLPDDNVECDGAETLACAR